MARPNKHLSRVKVFSFQSNPAIDQPILRKSSAYAQELIAEGQAFRLSDGSVQMRPPREYAADLRNKVAAPGDWITRHVSRLPNGEQLFITTKQLLTGPGPMRTVEA